MRQHRRPAPMPVRASSTAHADPASAHAPSELAAAMPEASWSSAIGGLLGEAAAELATVAADPVGWWREDPEPAVVSEPAGPTATAPDTLALAATRLEGGPEATHYRRSGHDRSTKEQVAMGADGVDTFWCSALSLWTLGAAGVDTMNPLLGCDATPHGYVDANGYEAIRPWMLLDGQREAVAAAGALLALGDLDRQPGRTVWVPSGEVREGVQTRGRRVLDRGAQVAAGDGSATGFEDASLYEAGTSDTEAGVDYDDSLAVMGAPGVIELLGVGERVPISGLRPGDFAQAFEKNAGGYHGRGHAWQVWSARLQGDAWFGGPDGPTRMDGPTPTTPTWLEDVTFVVDRHTDADAVGEATVLDYRAIEANVGGVGDIALDADGGVGLSDDRTLDSRHSAQRDRREYYGRLFTSPWSSQRHTPAEAPREEGVEQADRGEAGWFDTLRALAG